MSLSKLNFLGYSKSWWLVLIAGIVMVLCGFAYWFWPVAGYAVASQIFGWLLILAGIVQLIVAAGPHFPKGWGWWIAGGMIDMFIGFLMVRSIILSEEVFPYFLALIFIYWGITMIISSVNGHKGILVAVFDQRHTADAYRIFLRRGRMDSEYGDGQLPYFSGIYLLGLLDMHVCL